MPAPMIATSTGLLTAICALTILIFVDERLTYVNGSRPRAHYDKGRFSHASYQ
ncbi:Uncharacterised protein [Mycobacteroides abscessus subsp. abscessus]|nr:Uncharacterised protein [Mycobacteroides abscessus subsp. abscessus]